MMRKILVLALGGLILSATHAFAGWYHVENYEGTRGAEAIHMSIQTYDSFGSGLNVQASYYTDTKQTPVTLYGKARGKTLELCQISSDEEFKRILVYGSKTGFYTAECPLKLQLDDKGGQGVWKDAGKKLQVSLTKIATLDDTGDGTVEGKVEIPFWSSSPTHRFSGIYTRTEVGICMEKLEIINKSTRKIEQEIDFNDPEICNAGNVMTTIYRNVEHFTENGMDNLMISFSGSGAGTDVTYVYDPKSKKYAQAQ